MPERTRIWDGDTRVTRLRTYYVWNFASLALARTETGDFVTGGVSYGTTPKVVADCLNFAHTGRKWWLIDPLDGWPDPSFKYNVDLENAQSGWNPNAQAEWILEPLPGSLNSLPSSLAFVHLNTGNFDAELESLPTLGERVCSGGFILLDQYGWRSTDQQLQFDTAVHEAGLESFELPTYQLVIWKP